MIGAMGKSRPEKDESAAVSIRDPRTSPRMDRVVGGFGIRFGKIADLIGLRAAVAERLDIGVSTLQRYIAEESMPPFDVCAALCKVAQVRMEWLAFDISPMHSPDAAWAIDPHPRASQPARQPTGFIDAGLLGASVRITDKVLKNFELRDQLSSEQFADLTQLVFNDLARGAAEDVAIASLGRILAINRKP
jgi:hypothetical protein